MPRRLTFDVIHSTLNKKQPFDEAFNQHSLLNKLQPRDLNFAYNLSITILRRLGQIDNVIYECLNNDLPKKGEYARTILRIGICQILFLNTPSHAAVDTSVKLAIQKKQSAYKNLINAILRRVAREGPKLIQSQDTDKLNTPDWLWDSWIKEYGENTTRKIAKAHLKIPALDLSVKSKPELWAKKLGGYSLPTGGVRLLASKKINSLDGFNDGAWWVQDAAASIPVQLFGNDLKGKKIADICAAPGGKTAQLLASGAEVIAVDRSKKRIKILQENLERLSFCPEIIYSDAEIWRPKNLLDGVLVDAPCSSTGTIRRNPDIKYQKNAEYVELAQQIQLRLLEAATEMVKPSGKIVYSTCSLQPEEGKHVIDLFLSKYKNWHRKANLPKNLKQYTEFITKSGDIRTLPFHLDNSSINDNSKNNTTPQGMDGFFITCLVQNN